MAQSRPPPSRSQTTPASSHYKSSNSRATSPNPLSPRTHSHHHGSEKRHHSRRKSGRGSEHVMTSSEKKSSTSKSSSTRKQTSQHAPKASTERSSHREDRDRDNDRRDSGEFFEQFWRGPIANAAHSMSCEKQFIPSNNAFLYCSDACRLHDLNPTSQPAPLRTTSYPGPHSAHSPPLTPYGMHFPTSLNSMHEEGPDIIPRFSPSVSRPRSYFSSDPYPESYQPPSILSASVPHKKSRHDSEKSSKYTTSSSHRSGRGSTTALESLREIAGALPKVDKKDRKDRKSTRSAKDDRHNKDSSDDSASIRRNGSAVWSYIPFTSSSSATTPAHSYTQSSIHSYDNGSSREDLHATNSYSYGNMMSGGTSYGNVVYSSYAVGSAAMDRPLPPRGGPGHRPKSVDLVTPYTSGH